MSMISSNSSQDAAVPAVLAVAARAEQDADAYVVSLSGLCLAHSQHVEFIAEMTRQIEIIIQRADDDPKFSRYIPRVDELTESD
jgi:hypothetical protein